MQKLKFGDIEYLSEDSFVFFNYPEEEETIMGRQCLIINPIAFVKSQRAESRDLANFSDHNNYKRFCEFRNKNFRMNCFLRRCYCWDVLCCVVLFFSVS